MDQRGVSLSNGTVGQWIEVKKIHPALGQHHPDGWRPGGNEGWEGTWAQASCRCTDTTTRYFSLWRRLGGWLTRVFHAFSLQLGVYIIASSGFFHWAVTGFLGCPPAYRQLLWGHPQLPIVWANLINPILLEQILLVLLLWRILSPLQPQGQRSSLLYGRGQASTDVGRKVALNWCVIAM